MQLRQRACWAVVMAGKGGCSTTVRLKRGLRLRLIGRAFGGGYRIGNVDWFHWNEVKEGKEKKKEM